MRFRPLAATALVCVAAIATPTAARADRRSDAEAKAAALKAPVTLKFWQTHNAEETLTLKALLGEFEKTHPNVKVAVDTVAFAEAQHKFKTASKAGDAPDLFRCEVAWTAELASLGYLTPLDDYLSDADRKTYLETPLRASTYKEETWALPQVTDCLALLYNKATLKAAGVDPPRTMAELVTASRKLTDPAAKRVGFNFPSSDSYFLLPYIWSFGGGLIDEAKREVLIDGPGAVKGLEFVVGLKTKEKVVPADFDVANDYTNQMEAFKSGKQAMMFMGPWATATILSGDAFKDPANLGVADLPAGPGGTGSPIGGHGYTISASSKEPDLAFLVIDFLNRPENQAKFTVKNNLLPTRKAAYDLREVKGNAIVAGFRHQLETARTRPVLPEGATIFPPLTQGFQDALRGVKTPEAALKAVAAEWRKTLKP